MPLKEVGDTCGYRDYSNFYRAFNREVGISPSRYRLYQPSVYYQGVQQKRHDEFDGTMGIQIQTAKSAKNFRKVDPNAFGGIHLSVGYTKEHPPLCRGGQ